ncbi:MAG: Lrp/AsnC family transcriptional regulator [Oligosphaeraceae bacterium]
MNLQERNEAILALLKRDARIPVQEIADRLMLQPQEVSQAIEEMERQGTILGYTTLLGNEEERQTRAIIEVQIQPERDSGFDAIAQRICKFEEVVSAYLVSGRYDLHLEVVGNSLQEVAHFVASKLSTQPGVKSCATLFLLKKYKEAGIEFQKEEGYERLQVSM